MKKSQRRTIALVLVAVGAILLVVGFNAANSPLEELGETLTGRYSQETMAYLIGGAVLVIIGLVLGLRR